MILRT